MTEEFETFEHYIETYFKELKYNYLRYVDLCEYRNCTPVSFEDWAYADYENHYYEELNGK